MRAVPLSFLVLVLVLMAVARVAAAVERIDVADGVDFGGGEGGDEAFKKRFLKLWTDGGGGDEEDHLRWYGDDDDDYGDIYDDKKVEEMVKEEEEEEGEDGIMLGATRCPNLNKKKKKKRNVVKVDSYGAVGDGCADDTEVCSFLNSRSCQRRDMIRTYLPTLHGVTIRAAILSSRCMGMGRNRPARNCRGVSCRSISPLTLVCCNLFL